MRLKTSLTTTAATVLLLAGCGESPAEETEAAPGDGNGDFPVTVGDLTLDAQPTRIVSLSPSVTEMLFAIDAGEQVVAADEHSNYPPEAPTTELSGFQLNVEAVAEHEPDLVVLSSFADEFLPQLEQVGIPVHVAPDTPATVDDVYAQVVELGALTGRAAEAETLVDEMSQDIAELVAAAPARDEPLTYYIEIDDTLWTHTADSLIGSLFGQIGLSNIADEPGTVSMQLSPETVIDADPDLIFLTNTAYGVDAESVADRDGWAQIEAVQTDQIVELDSDVSSRWGPRIVELLEAAIDVVAQVS